MGEPSLGGMSRKGLQRRDQNGESRTPQGHVMLFDMEALPPLSLVSLPDAHPVSLMFQILFFLYE